MAHPRLKRLPLFGAGFLMVLVGLAALVWGRRVWKITHPEFKTHITETRSFRASYPMDWTPVAPQDPRLGEKEVTFLNHLGATPEASPWDRARMAMTLRDEGSCASLEDFVLALRKDSQNATAPRSWRLANGAVARAWRETGPTVDIPSTMRWVALRGSNGHCYSAAWMESSDWKVRWRYQTAFRDILGSVEFK